MKFTSSLLSLAAIAIQTTSATPIIKRASAPTDSDIAQYALTLEHLENAFYTGALAKYDQAAFDAAGFPSDTRARFVQIGEHEAAHVAILESILGDKANKPCEYSFPYTDPKSFAALAMVLEGVGSSAYLGAAMFIMDKGTLTGAASILATEARHASWISGAVLKAEPWSGPYETPLSLSEVFTLAASFITSCPSSNLPLPVKAFPGLTVEGTPSAGKAIQLKFDKGSSGDDLYLALLTGLSVEWAKIDTNMMATLPSGLMGTVYGVVSKQKGALTDDSTVAGPAILRFPF